jgi:3-hydroxybutyryl-CoA dehydrogenase
MQVLIIQNTSVPDSVWNSLLQQKDTSVCRHHGISEIEKQDWDLLIDFDFELHPSAITNYKQCKKPVLIASVLYTLQELQINHEPIARFNHWNEFENKTLLEYAVTEKQTGQFEQLFEQLHIPATQTADVTGFITPRILSLIINEAYLAVEENVSGRAEIDTAMKLGTNYPYGPFEWCERIGVEKVHSLLTKLSVTDSRYQPASQLKQKC